MNTPESYSEPGGSTETEDTLSDLEKARSHLDVAIRSCLADQVIRGTISRIIAARTIASDISGRRS